MSTRTFIKYISTECKINTRRFLVILLNNKQLYTKKDKQYISGSSIYIPRQFVHIYNNNKLDLIVLLLKDDTTLELATCIQTHRQQAPQIWDELGMRIRVLPLITAAYRAMRPDIKAFVRHAYTEMQIIHNYDIKKANDWLVNALPPWKCEIGSSFHKSVLRICTEVEIIGIQVPTQASLQIYGTTGILWTETDAIIMALILIFKEYRNKQYDNSVPQKIKYAHQLLVSSPSL